MEVFVVCNRKGGCGKTSTATAMFSYLDCIAGKKTLFIDVDSQCNASYAFGADLSKPSLYDVLMGHVSIKDAMQAVPPHLFGAYVVCGADLLANIENGYDKPTISLKDALKTVANEIDYVVIDTAPALGYLTSMALLAADRIIIPATADVYNLQGIQGIVELVAAINPKAKVEGILLTRFRERLLINRRLKEMAGETAKDIGTKIFDTVIRDGVAISESAAMQKGLFDYDGKMLSNVAQDYANFMEEVLEEDKGKE